MKGWGGPTHHDGGVMKGAQFVVGRGRRSFASANDAHLSFAKMGHKVW
jgi:hypothetical protein